MNDTFPQGKSITSAAMNEDLFISSNYKKIHLFIVKVESSQPTRYTDLHSMNTLMSTTEYIVGIKNPGL